MRGPLLQNNFWEHRSFAEQGLDTILQIHLGEKASALERAGIQTIVCSCPFCMK